MRVFEFGFKMIIFKSLKVYRKKKYYQYTNVCELEIGGETSVEWLNN